MKTEELRTNDKDHIKHNKDQSYGNTSSEKVFVRSISTRAH
jgi:hypothetical protein